MLDMITVGDIKLDTFAILNDASVQCQLKMPGCQLCVEYGGKITMDVIESQMAGSAPNVAVALARMKKKTAVISNMGNDLTYDLALKRLKEEGVNASMIKSIKGAKSAYSIVLNFKGDRTIFTSHNHNKMHLPKSLPKTKWLYVSEMGNGYESFYREVAQYSRKNKVLLGLNPGSTQIKEKKPALFNLMKVTEVLFVNLKEAHQLLDKPGAKIRNIAAGLMHHGPKQVVITDGIKGSYGFNGTDLYFCPIFPGEKIEATGAGDAFAAAYIGAIMDNKDMPEGLRWGSVNAASAVHHIGPQKGLLTQNQIISRLRKRKGYKVKNI